jgi:cellulose synthase/poly-beta-1,6-N-acetylglucosamine synthase-like glycosyltransferase
MPKIANIWGMVLGVPGGVSSLVWLFSLGLALLSVVLYTRQAMIKIPKVPVLQAKQGDLSDHGPSIDVVIPAYNEAFNIRDCLLSVLGSSKLPNSRLTVWLVDDQSTDQTLEIGRHLQHELNDSRFQILQGQSRPESEQWTGKNWACFQGAQQATSDYLLFLDADVRLQTGALEAALDQAEHVQADLLSCCPRIICGCWAEWLVQPILVSQILAALDFTQVNTRNTKDVFAAGPFMLFRRSAYEQIGGHRSVASYVVEDVELGRRIKQMGLTLWLTLGPEFVSVRMYRSGSALWEGWTKNLYEGVERNWQILFMFSLTMLVNYTLPWVGLIVLLTKMGRDGDLVGLEMIALWLALGGIWVQYVLRRASAQINQVSSRYWWLSGLGGLAIAGIALGSIIKTETGWGWTWRGRSLKQLQDGA